MWSACWGWPSPGSEALLLCHGSPQPHSTFRGWDNTAGQQATSKHQHRTSRLAQNSTFTTFKGHWAVLVYKAHWIRYEWLIDFITGRFWYSFSQWSTWGKNDTKVQYLSCKCSSLVIGGPQSNKIRGRKCALLLLHLFLITFSKRWLALPSSCKNKSGAEIKSSALCSAVRLLQTECQDHTCLGPGNSSLVPFTARFV